MSLKKIFFTTKLSYKIYLYYNLYLRNKCFLNKSQYSQWGEDILISDYFKNKSGEKKDQKKRKKYIRLDKNILNMMDIQIKRFDGKPSDGFTNFIENIDSYFQKVEKEKINAMLKDEANLKKIKKTYKNRYFLCNK